MRLGRPLASIILGLAGVYFLEAFPGNESAPLLGLLLLLAAVLSSGLVDVLRRPAATTRSGPGASTAPAVAPPRFGGSQIGWAGLILLGLALVATAISRYVFGTRFGGSGDPSPFGGLAYGALVLAPFVSLIAAFTESGRGLGVLGLVLLIPTLIVTLVMSI